MKTQLPASINSVSEAKELLKALFDNGESFHPEDDARDLSGDIFTKKEGVLLNKLMGDIYKLEQVNKDGNNKYEFDPCDYLLSLMHADDEYLIEGWEVMTLKKIMEGEERFEDYQKEQIKEMGLDEEIEFAMDNDNSWTIKRIS